MLIDGSLGETAVFSEREDAEDGEIDAFVALLREIDARMGPSTSRYSPRRIFIRVEPGDKWEPPVPDGWDEAHEPSGMASGPEPD
jgi:hypothetical protein